MTDPPHPPSPKLTSAITAFLDELRTGDVLLFNSLHPVSHAIKLVDNSPVNHCAIYDEHGEQILHASLPITRRDERGRDVSISVRADSLVARLRKGADRTVTAMRVDNAALGGKVVGEARHWIKLTTRYGFKGLPSLGAQCVNRSYGRSLSKRQQFLLYQAARAMSAPSRATVGMRRAELSVTCSEFVYSCYMIVDQSSIRIHDPLSVWKRGRWLKVPVTKYDARSTVLVHPASGKRVRALPIIDPQLGDADEPVLSDPGPEPEIAFRDWADPRMMRRVASSPNRALGRDFDARIANERLALVREMLRNYRNRDEGKIVPLGRQSPPPYAQAVTPFDLWQSPSLTAVCVLHLPPLPGDPIINRRGESIGSGGRARNSVDQ